MEEPCTSPSKMPPAHRKNRPETFPKMPQTNDTPRAFSHLGAERPARRPRTFPKRPQNSPRGSGTSPKRSQDDPQEAPRRPKRLQNCPKRHQDAPQEVPKTAQDGPRLPRDGAHGRRRFQYAFETPKAGPKAARDCPNKVTYNQI